MDEPTEYTLKAKEALAICVERGYPLSREGLYRISAQHGLGKFFGQHCFFSARKINQYIDDALTPIPEGLVDILTISKKLNVPKDTAYYWVKKKYVQSYIYGPGRGIIYVNEQEFTEFHKERTNGKK